MRSQLREQYDGDVEELKFLINQLENTDTLKEFIRAFTYLEKYIEELRESIPLVV